MIKLVWSVGGIVPKACNRITWESKSAPFPLVHHKYQIYWPDIELSVSPLDPLLLVLQITRKYIIIEFMELSIYSFIFWLNQVCRNLVCIWWFIIFYFH